MLNQKRRFGQYMLTAMLEADGWRIASFLSAASIEPSGVVATVDAFAHPICKTEANIFPTINIIPVSSRSSQPSRPGTPPREIGKVYPKVYFHSEASLSMAEAQSIANQNSWRLATATEVQEAFLYHRLHAYADGRMADGRFAVPVQTDHTNFKRGANIGAVGGNQGFFYIVLNNAPPVLPPLNNGYVRIKNKSSETTYIHSQNGKPEGGQILGHWASAQWKIVKYAGRSVNIQSRSNPNLLLNNNNGRLELVNIANNRASAVWDLSPSNDRGWVYLQNNLNCNHYIYMKDGKLQLGPVQGNESLWKLE